MSSAPYDGIVSTSSAPPHTPNPLTRKQGLVLGKREEKQRKQPKQLTMCGRRRQRTSISSRRSWGHCEVRHPPGRRLSRRRRDAGEDLLDRAWSPSNCHSEFVWRLTKHPYFPFNSKVNSESNNMLSCRTPPATAFWCRPLWAVNIWLNPRLSAPSAHCTIKGKTSTCLFLAPDESQVDSLNVSKHEPVSVAEAQYGPGRF